MKLALGTVQFGLDYGVANRSGQVTEAEIAAILDAARDAGIATLDTAVAYGNSEARLGQAGVSGFDVVSKLPALGEDVLRITEVVKGALSRMRIPKLYGLLLHRSQDLVGPHRATIFAALSDLRTRGLVRKIGVSIYDPAELDDIVPRFALDLVQAPYNVFDRRLVASGWLDRLKDAGIEVHTRSAFLQGLLLLAPDQRPDRFARWSTLLTGWDAWLREADLSPVQASLGFACGIPAIDRVIVGVDSRVQLSEIIRDSAVSMPSAPLHLSTEDVGLINPANWNVP